MDAPKANRVSIFAVGAVLGGLDRAQEFFERLPRFSCLTILLLLFDAPVGVAQTAPVRNLGAETAFVEGEWLVYSVFESFADEDLNGDGDTEDTVLHFENLATGDITNLRLGGSGLVLSGGWLLLSVPESGDGVDLNGDGDSEDSVLHLHNRSRGETTNLGARADFSAAIHDEWLVYSVWETFGGRDLNADGDTSDVVVHVRNLSTGETTNLRLAGTGTVHEDWVVMKVRELEEGKDLNGDGDTEDFVVHLHRLSTGEAANVGYAGWVSEPSGGWLLLSVSEYGEGADLNGDGDIGDGILHLHNLSTGETTNLGAPHWTGAIHGEWMVYSVSETFRGGDLNDDGDTEDSVVHLHNLTTGDVTNLRLAGYGFFTGDWLVLQAPEWAQNADLDGDGQINTGGGGVVHVHNLSLGETANLGFDTVSGPNGNAGIGGWSGDWLVFANQDRFVHVYNLSSGETTNLELRTPFDHVAQVSQEWVLLLVSERKLDEDLNFDRDVEDVVVHVHRLSTGETTNLRLAATATVFGDWLVLSVSEAEAAEDLNRDGDTEDSVAHFMDLSNLGTRFLRGECNDDGEVNLADAVCSFDWLFTSQATPSCIAALNTNGDEDVDLSDVVWLLNFLFAGGPAPAEPFGECGPSLLDVDQELGCLTPPRNCQP